MSFCKRVKERDMIEKCGNTRRNREMKKMLHQSKNRQKRLLAKRDLLKQMDPKENLSQNQ